MSSWVSAQVMYQPMADGWLIGLGAAVLLLLVVVFGIVQRGARWLWVLRALMVVTVVGILVRPGIGVKPTESLVRDLEVLVVVDRTASMGAEDWNGNKPRMEGVRKDLRALSKNLPSSRFALMTFGGSTRLELPFSSDTQTFNVGVATIQREHGYYGSGSTVDAPLANMTEVLERAEEQHPDRNRAVIFVSDGENTESEGSQESFEGIDDLTETALVLGYGTEEGGKMLIDPEEPGDYITDDDYNTARSHIDEENLKTIADQMGGDYLHRTEPGGLDAWTDKLEEDFTKDESDEEAVPEHELYWMFALALFAMALVDLRSSWGGVHHARRELKAS